MIKKIAIHGYLMSILTTQAIAAGSDHGASHSDGHHETSGGLPQLDPSSYASQTFWLVLVFGLLYVILSRKSIPAISQTVESRTERVQNDLDSASRLKSEVEDVQAKYEESLATARSEASALFRNIEVDIQEKTDAHSQEFQEKSAAKISALEKSIVKARKKAIDEMSDIAADIAAEAAEKIIGVKADPKSAKAVVKSISKAA